MFDVQGDHRLRTSNGKASELFERGWTLQELLAPKYVSLYDRDWLLLGTKESLGHTISQITKIDEAILRGESLTKRSIAQRMSWASGRKTTRIEDRAYSLLGIFGVYMPTLYGEGENAFLRLQQEIIRQSDDHSIFAWPIQSDDQPGLLAPSPDVFSDCEHVIAMSSRRGRSPYSTTNRGLSIRLMAVPTSVDTYFARLNCADERMVWADDEPTEPRLGMYIRRLQEDDQYARVKHDGRTFAQARQSFWDPRGKQKVFHLEFCVKQSYSGPEDDKKDRINGFRVATRDVLKQTSAGKNLFRVGGPCKFYFETGIMIAKPGSCGTTGWLEIDEQHRALKCIKLGFDMDFNPVCFLASSTGLTEKARKQQVNIKEDQLPGIHQRDAFDQLAWNEIRGKYVQQLQHHSGLWALKGDRLDGLNVNIQELCALRIVRGDWSGMLIWEVHLEKLNKSFAGDVKDFSKRPGTSRDQSDLASSSLPISNQ